ncbi:TetR/AcrR family transcriptional regulator [Aureibacillus halotolerans]|uniref:TetR family transcriptional regulator n=1 Tax=Aureibacillus halotolerans TaxID=1508390 RepID=A0A4V6PWJ2_9BACI|nr:TetR/AcrR family transcriptional regulator [Aureibacillus halotolerans]TDQ41427.1 TetR family transcriptional regulator [Aureibacillus halotolerans]
MAPLSEEQLIQKREIRREQIIEAAFKVFAHRGLNRAKMTMIAEEAGLSAGQLYRFFESKEELFSTLIHRAMKESINGIESIYELPGTPYEKLKMFTQSVFEDESSRYPFMLIQQAHTADEMPHEVKQIIKQFSMKNYFEILLPLFKEGQKMKEFVEGDLEELISSYLIMFSALATFNMPVDEHFELPKAEIFLRVITGPKA